MRALSAVSAAVLLASPAGGLVAVPRVRRSVHHAVGGGGASLQSPHRSGPHRPLAVAKRPADGGTALPASAASLDEENDGSARVGFRSRVRSAASAASRRVSSLRDRSKRDSARRRLAGACVAFSALFFVVAGRNGGAIDQSSDARAAVHHTSAGSAGRVVRGGSAAPSLMSRAVSRLRPSSNSVGRVPAKSTLQTSWRTDVRGGGSKTSKTTAVEEFGEHTTRTFTCALRDLNKYMKGPKRDTLCLLLATALITPLCKSAGLSPILGFLASGMLLGPNGLGVISGIHNTEHLGELGIVFFLFEMGIELSVERLKSMKKDVFGLGLSQYLSTAAVIGLAAKVLGGLSGPASVVVGGALSLSSSAFVLQLLKDKKELATRVSVLDYACLSCFCTDTHNRKLSVR